MELQTKINGNEVILRDITIKEYFEIIDHLKKQDVKLTLSNKEKDKVTIDNHQYENQNSYQPIRISFDIDKAMSLPCSLYNYDNHKSIHRQHIRFQVRYEVLAFFISTKNIPVSMEDLARYVITKVKTSKTSVKVYVTEMVRLGIIAKDTEMKTYHVSKWFLSKISN